MLIEFESEDLGKVSWTLPKDFDYHMKNMPEDMKTALLAEFKRHIRRFMTFFVMSLSCTSNPDLALRVFQVWLDTIGEEVAQMVNRDLAS